MGKYLGPVKYKGKIGGLVHRASGIVSKVPVFPPTTSPVTLANNNEFSLANKAAKLLYNNLRPYIVDVKDPSAYNRVVSSMRTIINNDVTNPAGKRQILNQELIHLKGLHLNINSVSNAAFLTTAKVSIKPHTSIVSIDFNPYIPSEIIPSPKTATHYKLIALTAEIDLNKDDTIIKNIESPHISLATKTIQITQLELPITPNTPNPIITTLGIKFYQIINNTPYPFQNTNYNSFQIIDVKTPQ